MYEIIHHIDIIKHGNVFHQLQGACIQITYEIASQFFDWRLQLTFIYSFFQR